MTTAGARTNAVGNAIDGASDIDINCKTDQFKIDTSGRATSIFCLQDLLIPVRDGQNFCLGDLLSHPNDTIAIIADSLADSCVSLRSPCRIMEHTGIGKSSTYIEVWTKDTRLMCVKGRVYGHKIH